MHVWRIRSSFFFTWNLIIQRWSNRFACCTVIRVSCKKRRNLQEKRETEKRKIRISGLYETEARREVGPIKMSDMIVQWPCSMNDFLSIERPHFIPSIDKHLINQLLFFHWRIIFRASARNRPVVLSRNGKIELLFSRAARIFRQAKI